MASKLALFYGFCLNLNAHPTYRQVKSVQVLMTKYRNHPLNKHNSLMSKHYALTQAFINGPAGPKCLQMSEQHSAFLVVAPCHFMPCIQSVHLTSHFKYRRAKGMTNCVCSPMLHYFVDYIRIECAIICYFFPA